MLRKSVPPGKSLPGLSPRLVQSPQAMTFNPRSKETLASLEEASRRISEYQHRDPFLCGYPAVSSDAIMYHYRDKIQKLLDLSGLSTEEQEEHLLVPLRNLADCIHLVPASGLFHHLAIGGLFEHSIECATFAASTVKNSTLIRKTLGRVHLNRWVLAAILCGLFHDLGKVMVDAQIYNASKQDKFDPHKQKLTDWMAEKIGPENVYFVYWKPKHDVHMVVLSFMVETFNIISDSTYQWLSKTVAKEVVRYFKNNRSALKNTIDNADHASVQYSMNRGQYLRSTEKPLDHDEINFFEAVKRLLFYGTQNHQFDAFTDDCQVKGFGWTVNTSDSAVICCEKYLYIVFDELKQIRIALEAACVPTNIFNLNKCSSELSEEELGKELEKLVNHLKDGGFLRLCGDSPYWYGQRIDRKSGEANKPPLKLISLSGKGIFRLSGVSAIAKCDRNLFYISTTVPIEKFSINNN